MMIDDESFFVRRSIGHQARTDYTAEQLLKMSKTQMSRILCAYEHALPGSAAEKLSQRNVLEVMLNQLEDGVAWLYTSFIITFFMFFPCFLQTCAKINVFF